MHIKASNDRAVDTHVTGRYRRSVLEEQFT
jgi:hypothetical protein